MVRSEGDELKELKEQVVQARACVVEVLCDMDRLKQERVDGKNLNARARRELHALHRCLVERLHPFTNPEADDSCKRRLALVRLALRRGDVPMMRSLEMLTRAERGSTRALDTLQSVDECRAELALVNAHVNVMHEQRELLRGRVRLH
ncbi:MAG: hypothetical protein J5804_04955 [Eggerthellaceae bacterium]|nr:hypothetical protein [Eggerthellaceae bacterium]